MAAYFPVDNHYIYELVRVIKANNDPITPFSRTLIWTLKPSANTAAESPTFPPLSATSAPYIGRVMRQHLHVHFQGWTSPPDQWCSWILRLCTKHYLSLLKEKAFPPMVFMSLEEDCQETIPGPFQLIHQWALERFPNLAPHPVTVPKGGTRATQWRDLDLSLDATTINRELQSNPQSFKWRPYADHMQGWVPHYGNERQIVLNGLGSYKQISFGMCLCACELEGVANQKYMPHRVTRQFGIDQHLPGDFADMKPRNRMDRFTFFIPSNWHVPDVTWEYLNWWHKSKQLYELLHATMQESEGGQVTE